MDKDEYNHLHGYQDAKEKHQAKLDARAESIFLEMRENSQEILDALYDSLSENTEFALMVIFCRKNNCMAMLGKHTLDLIDSYLSERADIQAEEEL